MYKIVSGGKTVAYVEAPKWVNVVGGVSHRCSFRQATGIIAGGKAYNLVGHNDFPDGKTAWVHKVDGWEIVYDGSGRISIIDGNVADTQDAICEYDNALEEIQDALCEIDERIGE